MILILYKIIIKYNIKNNYNHDVLIDNKFYDHISNNCCNA